MEEFTLTPSYLAETGHPVQFSELLTSELAPALLGTRGSFWRGFLVQPIDALVPRIPSYPAAPSSNSRIIH